MGTGNQKDTIRSLEFADLCPISREGRGAGNGVNSQSCLCDEASIKIPKVWGLESFQVSENIHSGSVVHPSSTGSEAPALGTLPDLALCISSSGCSSVSFIISFNKLVNISKYVPEFCESP